MHLLWYNYQLYSTTTTLRFIPDHTPIKINVTLVNLTFVKRSLIVVKVSNYSHKMPLNASEHRDDRLLRFWGRTIYYFY